MSLEKRSGLDLTFPSGGKGSEEKWLLSCIMKGKRPKAHLRDTRQLQGQLFPGILWPFLGREKVTKGVHLGGGRSSRAMGLTVKVQQLEPGCIIS